MEWLEEVNNQEEQFQEILSFDEYMQRLNEKSFFELRTSAHYLKDMFDYFGKTDDGHFKLFKREHPGAPKVAGQFIAQEKIYNNLVN